jgi:hypothetical protein
MTLRALQANRITAFVRADNHLHALPIKPATERVEEFPCLIALLQNVSTQMKRHVQKRIIQLRSILAAAAG